MRRRILDGALIGLQVQLCVFPLLQDPVQLLCEGVVERRHALGVGLPQQHVAVPIHLPQHAGQSGREPIGVVHVGQRRWHRKRWGWRRGFGWRKLALAWNDLEETITQVPKGWHRDGPTILAAIAVAGDGFKFKVGAPLSLRRPQDLQPLLGELPVLSGPSGAEAHVKQHHSQHQAEASQNCHQGNIHGLHVSVGLELSGWRPRGWGGGQGLLSGAAGGEKTRAGNRSRVSRGCWFHREVRVCVHPDCVKIDQDWDRVLHSEAAIGPALLDTRSDYEEAICAYAVARIEAVSLEFFAI